MFSKIPAFPLGSMDSHACWAECFYCGSVSMENKLHVVSYTQSYSAFCGYKFKTTYSAVPRCPDCERTHRRVRRIGNVAGVLGWIALIFTAPHLLAFLSVISDTIFAWNKFVWGPLFFISLGVGIGCALNWFFWVREWACVLLLLRSKTRPEHYGNASYARFVKARMKQGLVPEVW